MRYILVFNDVSVKVSKVAPHSPAGGLDIEDITVTDPSVAPAAGK